MSFVGKVFRKITPRVIGTPISSLKILQIDYGHLKTAHTRSCIDAQDNPLPWYTYPAINYLIQLDFSAKKVFEYGSGNSSLFWASRAKQVISIEDNPDWFKTTSKQQLKNLDIYLAESKEDYICTIDHHNNLDVIIIDGSYRVECAQKAIDRINSGGLIILDNSDWYFNTASKLRNADFIQIDMTGFGPINFYTWTTSLFLHREFRFQSKTGIQPLYGPGALRQQAEDD